MVRRVELVVLAVIIIVAALSTGAQFLFFLVYLGILVVGTLAGTAASPLRVTAASRNARARGSSSSFRIRKSSG